MHSRVKLILFFVLLSLLLRWPSFTQSVLNHDESTYLVIGREIVNNAVLYHDYTDTKPPGIFFISGGILKIAGNSILGFRVFTALVIAVTAFFISLTVQLFIKHQSVIIASGTIYIFITSIWLFFGVSPNTEHYYNLFTIAGAYVFLSRFKFSNILFAGVLWGVGFIIKYMVIFDVAAILLFFAIKKYNDTKKISTLLFNYLLLIFAFILPFLGIIIYYSAIGHFEAFWYLNFDVIQKYPSEKKIIPFVLFLLGFHLRFFPVSLFFYYSLFVCGKICKDIKLLSIIWLVFNAISVYLPGNLFGHYTIQLMLPFSIFAGTFFHHNIPKPKFMVVAISGRTGRIILAILVAAIMYAGISSYLLKEDTPRKVAAFIKKKTNNKDLIYSGNYHQIIYLLINKKSPTPYVHRGMIVNKRLQKAMNIDENKALHSIALQNPRIIVVKDSFPNQYFSNFIKDNYRNIKTFDKNIHVFERGNKQTE